MTLQVFISYHHEYLEFARKINAQLHGWGYETWLDKEKIKPSTYFRDAIQDGLEASDILIGIITEKAQKSREVMAEIDYFLSLKKPLVPFKFEDIKMRYIFVAIQYIDYVEKGEEKALAELKELLTELAQSTVESTISDAPKPEPVREEAEEIVLDDFLREKSEEKKEILEDGLFGGAATPTEDAPKPEPAPPQPITSLSPPGSAAAMPNAPIMQPARQQEYMPQPAPSGRKDRSLLLRPWVIFTILFSIILGLLLLNLNANNAMSTGIWNLSPPQVFLFFISILAISSIITVGILAFTRLVTILIRWLRKRTQVTDQSQIEIANRTFVIESVEDFWLKGVLNPALEAGTLDIGLSTVPRATLRHEDFGNYSLPPNANILDIFNDLNCEMLILGVPGGGKTVLLLQLARKLIEQAKRDTSKAIPVVFNLSSWINGKSFETWLVSELRQKYHISKNEATVWVKTEKLILLLDGLDEVGEQYRNDCVDEINNFRLQYSTIDLVVCSRVGDYSVLTSKLDVRSAIILEPLSQPIINAYLNRPELENLRQIMAYDMELQEMSKVPFLLNAMVYAYAGVALPSLPLTTSETTSKVERNHLFDQWVEKRLTGWLNTNYTPHKIQRWLGWLAQKMVADKKIVFYIEDLQPSWLAEKQWFYRIGVGLILGLIFGLAITPAVGPITGIVVGLMFAMVTGLTDITLFDMLKWQLGDLDIIGASKIVIAVSLIMGFASGLKGGLNIALGNGMTVGIILSIIITVLGEIYVRENAISRTRPNEGVRHSAYKAVQVIVIFGLAPGLLSRLVSGLMFTLAVALSVSGAEGVIKHITLRFFLWHTGDAPWNYARFLDYCASAGIMRKVGGGYIFAHRYLMEYFAESYVEDSK